MSAWPTLARGTSDDPSPRLRTMAARPNADAVDRGLLGDAADRAEDRAGSTRPDDADLVPLRRGHGHHRRMARLPRRARWLPRAGPPRRDDAGGRGTDAGGQLRLLPAGGAAHHAGQRAVADPARAAADGAGRHLGV